MVTTPFWKGCLELDDKTLGYILFIGSLFGVGCYFYLMFISPWGLLVLQASVFLTVAAVLVTIAWIGYLMATEPSGDLV